MQTDKNAAQLSRKRKKRPLGEEAKKEYQQYDVLDGPFATLFHRFFKRRIITKADMKPYPWFIGGIHRAARMLDVADVWERIVLLIFPVPFILAYLQKDMGVPAQLRGYGLLWAGAYTGFHFVLWVFLDRRLDYVDQSRVFAGRRKKVEARDERMLARRKALKEKPALRAAAAEAAKRGRMKAAESSQDHPPSPDPVSEPPIVVPARPVAVSLDDLLRQD
jgi:hypothetical protein